MSVENKMVMNKLTVKDLRNIRPLGEVVKLPYENEAGEEVFTEVKIYPLTVGEKITLQQYRDEIKDVYKKFEREQPLTTEEEKKLVEIINIVQEETLLFTLKKVIGFEDITKEDLPFIPKKWLLIINEAVLKTEGVDVEKLKKKGEIKNL